MSMWTHYCPAESSLISTAKGEPCNWCGACEQKKALAVAAALGLVACVAGAQCAPHINAFAIHQEGGYENTTPGLGVMCRSDTLLAGAGRYRNSVAQWSNYAAVGWQPLRLGQLRAGAFAGVVNGYPYKNGAYFPFGGLIASHPWQFDKMRGEIHLTFIPKVQNISPATLGVSYTVRF